MANLIVAEDAEPTRRRLAKKSFFVALTITLLVLLAAGLFVLKLSIDNSKAVADAKLRRFDSLALVDHLRQNSDDLTRMARSYAATGETRFEEYFERILAIRRGEAPRPLRYDRVYWDYVVASGNKPQADGEPCSLRS